jgi:Tfp pilus assembly protein PilE
MKLNNLFIKYLQYFYKKQNSEKGTTLVEVLVVCVIAGVLVAVAVPILAAQIGKARETEIVTCLGTILKLEKTEYMKNATFATTMPNLGTSCSTQYISNIVFTPTNNPPGINIRMVNNNAVDNLTRAFSGRVVYNNNGQFDKIICRSFAVKTDVFAPNGTVNSLACYNTTNPNDPDNSERIK